jgi:hypothetical protein
MAPSNRAKDSQGVDLAGPESPGGFQAADCVFVLTVQENI